MRSAFSKRIVLLMEMIIGLLLATLIVLCFPQWREFIGFAVIALVGLFTAWLLVEPLTIASTWLRNVLVFVVVMLVFLIIRGLLKFCLYCRYPLQLDKFMVAEKKIDKVINEFIEKSLPATVLAWFRSM